MEDAKLKELLVSIKRAKAQGATGLKVELEAQLSRSYSGDDDEYCPDCDEGSNRCSTCDGDEYIGCSNCDSSGEVTTEEVNITTGQHISIDCGDCEGTGRVDCPEEHCDNGYQTCGTCDGDWDNYHAESEWSDAKCMDTILTDVSARIGVPATGDTHEKSVTRTFPWLVYAKFYNDGSVDSELTFTIDLTDEALLALPHFLKAFTHLADVIGNGMETKGAGMHMAFLFNEENSYPRYGESDLSLTKRQNFKRSMTQLLPALFFIGAMNDTTRPMGYRKPKISTGNEYDSDKYSAISCRLGAIEYRVFDTCYDDPDQILDNFVVMSKSLRFLSNIYISPNIDKLHRTILFGTDDGNSLERLYRHTTHLDVLNAGLKHLKPSYITITELKRQRKFTTNKRKLANQEKELIDQADNEYKEYNERFQWKKRIQRRYIQTQIMERTTETTPIDELRAMNEESLYQTIDGRVAQELTYWETRMGVDETNWKKSRIEKLNRAVRGEYELVLG